MDLGPSWTGEPPRGGRTSLDRFVAPARRGAAGLWRIPVTLALTLVLTLAAAFGVIFALSGLLERTAIVDIVEAGAPHPAALPVMLGTIVLMGAVAMLVVRLVHGRPAATLFGPARGLRVRPALRAGVIAAAVVTLSALFMGLTGLAEISWRATPYPTLSPLEFGALVALIALMIPLQSGAEELVFRGYLLQEAARRSRSALIWAVAPSILFGLIHIDPERMDAAENIATVAGTFAFGLCAAFLTARSGDLSLAIGFHAGNNLVALLLFEGPYGLNGPAPLAIDFPQDWGLGGLLAVLSIVGLLELAAIYALLTPMARGIAAEPDPEPDPELDPEPAPEFEPERDDGASDAEPDAGARRP